MPGDLQIMRAQWNCQDFVDTFRSAAWLFALPSCSARKKRTRTIAPFANMSRLAIKFSREKL